MEKSQIDYKKFKLGVKKKSKVGSKEDLAKMAAPKAAQVLYNIVTIGPRLIMRSAFQLLRANIITRIISAVVLVSIDTYLFVRKRISLKQYIINVAMAALLLVGGTLGWYRGQELGYILFENAVIGIIAGVIGAGVLGFVFSAIFEKIIGKFVKDDTKDMLDICNGVFCDLAEKYELTEEQAQKVAETVLLDAATVRKMYAAKDKTAIACEFIEPCIKEIKNLQDK
ncbi:MAG: hypothetical protein FWB98_07415 [Defluviitaleaceae bacterium]|nr:hypothetical protein [Defluviitaleaceae bacterium]